MKKDNNIIKESKSCSNCNYCVKEIHEYYNELRHKKMLGEMYCSKKNCSVGMFLNCDLWEHK